MKKVLLSASLLVGITATAQDYEKRVGINTETPRASLEVKAIINGKAQGILFPHIDEDEKARWAKDEAKGLVAGTVIWNTTKLCLDYFDGTQWTCTDGTKSNVHPTPWTPGATSFTGTAVWGDDAGEVISIAKNNCPTGQTGSTVTYPANTAQHITYTATSTVSQEDANQKAIALMNAAEKQQERQTLAQTYANQNGTCQTNTTTYTGTAIWGDDAGETLSVSKNNCPTGQTGSTVTYPANTAQRITYTATSNVSQADANQKAIALMNSAEKQQERQTLAQTYANQNGNCQQQPNSYFTAKCLEGYSGELGLLKQEDDTTFTFYGGINDESIVQTLGPGKYYYANEKLDGALEEVYENHSYEAANFVLVTKPGDKGLISLASHLLGHYKSKHIQNGSVIKKGQIYNYRNILGDFCGGVFEIK